nr:protein BTG1 [Pelodiscus sinensis]|eukprot:XP_014432997.1 protein BTG1 [Pelodiscus sinensis]
MHPALYTRASMIREIAAAVAFISKFLRTKGRLTFYSNVRRFDNYTFLTLSRAKQHNLFSYSVEHYKHHWFPEKPCKGSGYRCIRINHKMDPLIGQAAQRIGLSSQELFRLLPSELTLWVDPYEVSYRIGEDGSICVLYEAAPTGGSQNNTNMQMVDSRISCKEELLLGRTSPSKNYTMMTVSG